MIKKVIATAVIGIMLLSAPAATFAVDATVTLKGTGGGLLLAKGGGTGVLTYKGYQIPFEWSNISFGKIGVTTGEATGVVNGLSFLEKFNGCYTNSNLDATVISGGFSRQVKNKSGVVIDLKGKEQGLDVSVAQGCAKVVMDKDVLASVLAKLNAPPVAANLSSSIYFDTNSETIRDSEKAKIANVVSQLEKTPGTELVVTGYTDTVGSESQNKKLSEQRAQAVIDALTEHAKSLKVSSLPPQRVVVSGAGEVKGPEDKADQANRRVDISIVQPNSSAMGQYKAD